MRAGHYGQVGKQSRGDTVQFGPPERRRGRGRWLFGGIVALAVAVVLALVVQHRGTTETAPTVHVSHADLSWLQSGGGWELFARTGGAVVRIEAESGRVTRTTVPQLPTDGPVWFVVRRGEAIVHPLEPVRGYVVRDDQPARRVSKLPAGGALYPGPKPNLVWAQNGPDRNRASMRLLRLDGRDTGVSVTVATPMLSAAVPDGAGYLLLKGTSGVFEDRGGNLTRVTYGALLAVGPRVFVVEECGTEAVCHAVTVDRSDGSRHRLPGKVQQVLARDPGSIRGGVTSPDGQWAALTVAQEPEDLAVLLVDLSSGRATQVADHVTPAPEGSTPNLVWAPHSRWLFVVSTGGVQAVDARSGQVRALGLGLTGVHQIAVRSP